MLSQRLTAADRHEVAAHHAQLSEDDLHLRFGYRPNAFALQRYVDGLDFERDALYGVFDAQLHLKAFAHLAIHPQDPGSAEFGVSVAPELRGQGVGLALLARCVEHAGNAGVRHLFIQTLAENKPMLTLMLRHTQQIQVDGCERLADVCPTRGGWLSRLHEVTLDELAEAQHRIDKARLEAVHVWRGIRHYRRRGTWSQPTHRPD